MGSRVRGLVGEMVGWEVSEWDGLLVGGYVGYLVGVRVDRCGGGWVGV